MWRVGTSPGRELGAATQPAEEAAQDPGQGRGPHRPVTAKLGPALPGLSAAAPGSDDQSTRVSWSHISQPWCPQAHPRHLTPCQADSAGQGQGLG